MELRSPYQVRHVPALKRSLVSIAMLAEDGYRKTLSESSWMISLGINMKIKNGYNYNNLYPLMAINPEGVVNIGESWDSNLWHNLLGHMSRVGLDRLLANLGG
mgnify:CR=1 FL=1